MTLNEFEKALKRQERRKAARELLAIAGGAALVVVLWCFAVVTVTHGLADALIALLKG